MDSLAFVLRAAWLSVVRADPTKTVDCVERQPGAAGGNFWLRELDVRMAKLGYVRTSTDKQANARQIDGLEPHCDQVFVEDGVSAGRTRRPVYEQVLSKLDAGDTLVVWDLDRAFRSTVDAIQEMERMRTRGIEFQIITLNIDTATPAGMLIYTIVAAMAQWEREMLRKRTVEGIAAARRRGKRLGRPPKLTPRQLRHARAEITAGRTTITAMAGSLGVAPWTLTRAMRRQTPAPASG